MGWNYYRDLIALEYQNSDPQYNPEVYKLNEIKIEQEKLINSSKIFDAEVEYIDKARWSYELSIIIITAALTFIAYICMIDYINPY